MANRQVASDHWEYGPSKTRYYSCQFKTGTNKNSGGYEYPVLCSMTVRWRRWPRAGSRVQYGGQWLQNELYPPYLCTAHKNLVVNRRDYNK